VPDMGMDSSHEKEMAGDIDTNRRDKSRGTSKGVKSQNPRLIPVTPSDR